jgi:hypothetical protein
LLGGGFSVSSLPPQALSTIAAAVTVATVRSGHAIPQAMRAAGQTLIADVMFLPPLLFNCCMCNGTHIARISALSLLNATLRIPMHR